MIIIFMIPAYKSRTFASGYTGSKYNPHEKGTLVHLYQGNLSLIKGITGHRKYNVNKVKKHFQEFIDHSDKKCPKQIYDRVMEILEFIEYEVGFGSTGGQAYANLRDMIERLDELLLFILEADSVVSETVGGNRSINHLEDIMDENDYNEKMIRDYGQFKGEHADRLIKSLNSKAGKKVNKFLYSDQLISTIADADKTVHSGYDQSVSRGLIPAFDGDFEDYQRVKEGEKIENDEEYLPVQAAISNVDRNVAYVDGLSFKEHNHLTITNFRGRQYPRNFSGKETFV